MDEQSIAFRENPNPTSDEEILQMAQAVHSPLTRVSQILLPEDWEMLQWDSGREDPPANPAVVLYPEA